MDTRDGCRIVSTATPGKRKHLQSIAWPESLLAVRVSTECSSMKEMRQRLCVRTPAEFPQLTSPPYICDPGKILSKTNKIEQLPLRVCMAYRDDALLASVMGPLLLLAEPVLGVLFAERLLLLPPGAELAKDFFRLLWARSHSNQYKKCREILH